MEKITIVLGEEVFEVLPLKIKDLMRLVPMIGERPAMYEAKGIAALMESNLEIIAMATGKPADELSNIRSSMAEITAAYNAILKLAGLEVSQAGESPKAPQDGALETSSKTSMEPLEPGADSAQE